MNLSCVTVQLARSRVVEVCVSLSYLFWNGTKCVSQDGLYGCFVPKEKVNIEGATKVWVDTQTRSGLPMERHFCAGCGTYVVYCLRTRTTLTSIVARFSDSLLSTQASSVSLLLYRS
jgi:hypothetical protein